MKAFKADFVSKQVLRSFHIAVDVPGLVTDYANFDPSKIYSHEINALDENELRS